MIERLQEGLYGNECSRQDPGLDVLEAHFLSPSSFKTSLIRVAPVSDYTWHSGVHVHVCVHTHTHTHLSKPVQSVTHLA